MILTKDILTKSAKKGRLKAVSLLQELSRIGQMPEPHYEYKPGGHVKKPSHFFHVRFRVPSFLEGDWFESINGAGRCRNKTFAKSLAALEVVLRLEEGLGCKRGGVPNLLEQYKEKIQKEQERMESTPVEKQAEGVGWDNLPMDPVFAETQPATRRGRIDFFSTLVQNYDAFHAARAITLKCSSGLPEVAHHANQTDTGAIQRWANIKSMTKGKWNFGDNVGPTEMHIGIDKSKAEIITLERLFKTMTQNHQGKWSQAIDMIRMTGNDSFGTAKLFVLLPKHQIDEMKSLLDQVEDSSDHLRKEVSRARRHRPRDEKPQTIQEKKDDLKRRLKSFRTHQRKFSLPIDSIEKKIPFDAPVTVLRGGTGSGKTTRYPLMLSLLSPEGDATKVMVAQPRRLACQSAARRVAYEQGYEIRASGNGPIGYAIRFESFPAVGTRTVDFATPGVLLRRAMEDPLFQDITHLVIDEVHERNSDIDLLLALAKQAVRQRGKHETLPPLKLVLMSATLDSSQWESYFASERVSIVDVPNIRRFPIDIVHLNESSFPKIRGLNSLVRKDASLALDFDEDICKVVARLALHQAKKCQKEGGSILCFLPGMDEIRQVDRLINSEPSHGKPSFEVAYLHSSLSSQTQNRIFQPGNKIILSTNLAETSVTIPDVKVVIDSGRERQHSMLDTSSTDTTVVGSQLVTVNISQASAKQRAGRAGRVSAGTCFRLYTQQQYEGDFNPHTLPEMLRMDISQLVLHSLSIYHPMSGHPLQLIRDAPDPPSERNLRHTLRSLTLQGLVAYDFNSDSVGLTPLGRAVSAVPASPRLGRMLFVGLSLRALDPAIQIAALLSVPKVFSGNLDSGRSQRPYSSDMMLALECYRQYAQLDGSQRKRERMHQVFQQVQRVERQLASHMKTLVSDKSPGTNISLDDWNANSTRVGALVALICCATPHIAHLVSGHSGFATRDVAGEAKIHPSSVNFGKEERVHWYVYNELRATRQPYLHVTTAVSPLDLALFTEANDTPVVDDSDSEDKDDGTILEDKESSDYSHFLKVIQQWEEKHEDWVFIADQWVPVDLLKPSQRPALLKLRRLLMNDFLQQIAQNPSTFLSNPTYQRIVLFAMSALEQQRLQK